MKNLQGWMILGIACLAGCVGTTIPVQAQQTATAIVVKERLVEHVGDRLIIDMKLALDELSLPANRSLVCTPLIERGDSVRALPPVIVNGRNRQIQYDRSGRDATANGGASYRVLLRDIYPALRHSDYAVRYTIRSFTVEEARELIYSDPRQLSLNEMFQVAQTMEPGSDTYREVFEIAVRMYPDDPVSNLNAALTAIDAGRLESARRYLAKTSDSAERTLAEAAIAMLENRLDEAEALLGKLSDDPSVASQVEENLRQIAAKREELAD